MLKSWGRRHRGGPGEDSQNGQKREETCNQGAKAMISKRVENIWFLMDNLNSHLFVYFQSFLVPIIDCVWYSENIFIFITVAVYSTDIFAAISVVMLKHECRNSEMLVPRS